MTDLVCVCAEVDPVLFGNQTVGVLAEQLVNKGGF